MSEWRSPGVRVGIAAIVLSIVVSVGLFFADKLVSDAAVAEGWRNFFDVAAEAGPWIGMFGIAVGGYLVARALVRTLEATFARGLESAAKGQQIAEERLRQLERDLEETKKAPKAASAERAEAPAKPAQRHWVSISSGVLRLAIPNSELEAMYERAISVLNKHDPEPSLSWFYVNVKPYQDSPDRVYIALDFYSDRSEREYSFWMRDDGQSNGLVGSRRKIERPSMYERLPWREQPKWCEMVNQAAARAGSLIPDADTQFTIYASPSSSPLEWHVSVEDYGSRRKLDFTGTSPADMRQSSY
jgi:hypothetical protein